VRTRIELAEEAKSRKICGTKFNCTILVIDVVESELFGNGGTLSNLDKGLELLKRREVQESQLSRRRRRLSGQQQL